MSGFWCEAALIEADGDLTGSAGARRPEVAAGVRLEVHEGRISGFATGVRAETGDQILNGVVFPAAANAHSHAFHRILRGRTHDGRGDFWLWREQMYRSAAELTPEKYEKLAAAVFTEMVVSGFSSVAEFHYVHHQPGGTPYPEPHAMELALARAAVASGIRLTLLDTLYLAGGIGTPLSPEQARFGDADAEAWLDRLASLRAEVARSFPPELVGVGAALHSVRGVPEEALKTVAAKLPADIPLHIHLSEQPAENQACLEAYGVTPAALLARNGLLSGRLSAVHATHLTPEDIRLLGDAGATVVMCPTTEADLADGIGPARALSDAGSAIALGTDQHAVIDPWVEMRTLEHGERLGSGQRGRFSPQELFHAATIGATASMATPIASALEVGAVCDLMAVAPDSVRTAGSIPRQFAFSATASDVTDVVIAGELVASNGAHVRLGTPGSLITEALKDFS
ncbi:formimidoylglutamate deiminase [Arthrobacter bambusae]|uniref:formimidoylglutamate deiminase n=1 Tax=Arthrobacter bambusae TaxID=1338426 RepID=UPI002780B07E|nr:formimidoylglutamate deiminase [Arthrobacter bambusae]MDQ0031768.1 formiminoglutamate deiminase [Arthrobacter bambusae]MDQ0099954.1 formiminoglutamate deiminase [Arthrobacter bambusae]